MVELSVIVPTLKDPDEIQCLERLERDDFDDYEVLIQHERGASKARNVGIERASADKLVFLDDDSLPYPGYLAEAARVLEEEAVVAGRIIHPRDDIFGRHFTAHYEYGDEPRYVSSFISCNMALRREVFDTVGGFDENFVWGHEEKELAERVRAAYAIYYDPELVVEHTYADSYLDLWAKRYRQETQRPYYWHLHGVSPRGQLVRTVYTVIRPSRYLGETVPHTVAKAGVTVAITLGRLRGLLDRATSGPDEPASIGENRSVGRQHGVK